MVAAQVKGYQSAGVAATVQALPRARRHRDRQPLRLPGHRAHRGAVGRAGRAAVPGRHRRRHRLDHDRAHHGPGARPVRRPGHPLPPHPHRHPARAARLRRGRGDGLAGHGGRADQVRRRPGARARPEGRRRPAPQPAEAGRRLERGPPGRPRRRADRGAPRRVDPAGAAAEGQAAGCSRTRTSPGAGWTGSSGSRRTSKAADRIAERTTTLLVNSGRLLPLSRRTHRKVLVVGADPASPSGTTGPPTTVLAGALTELGFTATALSTGTAPSAATIAKAVAAAQGVDAVLVGTYNVTAASSQRTLVNQLARHRAARWSRSPSATRTTWPNCPTSRPTWRPTPGRTSSCAPPCACSRGGPTRCGRAAGAGAAGGRSDAGAVPRRARPVVLARRTAALAYWA